MSQALVGRCACGGVRYRLKTAPMIVHCCHCLDCQRQTGSAFVLNAVIETDRIEMLAGAPKPFALPTDSGHGHDVYRCEACGTAMWSDYGRRAYVRFVRVGTLDNPSALPPDFHIFTRSKLPWVGLPEDARAFEVFYNIEEEWPAESQQRRKTMMEGAA